jgi:hypothetical protein
VEFQSNRERPAIYGYLDAVFQLVVRWKKERRSKTSSLQALAAAKHPGSIRIPEPFAVAIFATYDPRVVDAKTRSKWGRGLQFAEQCKPVAQNLAQFIKSQGGINACAEQFSDRPRVGRR